MTWSPSATCWLFSKGVATPLLGSGRVQSLESAAGEPSTFLIVLPDLFRVIVTPVSCCLGLRPLPTLDLSRGGIGGWRRRAPPSARLSLRQVLRKTIAVIAAHFPTGPPTLLAASSRKTSTMSMTERSCSIAEYCRS